MSQELQAILIEEHETVKSINVSPLANELSNIRKELLAFLKEVGKSNDLHKIVTAEKEILEGDLARYANSKPMENSLKIAINELNVIQRHLGIVDNIEDYQAVNEAYSLPKNRQKGLPIDEARQAFRSHSARLTNQDKTRLDDDEKKIIDIRRSAFNTAHKIYQQKQAKTLDTDLSQSQKKSRSR